MFGHRFFGITEISVLDSTHNESEILYKFNVLELFLLWHPFCSLGIIEIIWRPKFLSLTFVSTNCLSPNTEVSMKSTIGLWRKRHQ